MAKTHTVYMLECGDGTLYTGYTNDLSNRLNLHERGKGAKYTRGRGPFKVRLQKSCATKQEALSEEYRIKQLQRVDKLALIRQEQGADHARTEKL